MRHLRDNGIVHRDIKPGNIMKYEDAESGRFIYKLIDFGAARELEDDGQFMSLYGTEEYLHPDLYQRAVLRRPMSKKQFGVGVDLWSLGVTFYHAATGHLPFRPYRGRKDKNMMYKITTEKVSGIISAVQSEENGEVQWSRDLPKTCCLSQGGKDLVTPILAGLMECDTRRMLDFPTFFALVDDAVKNRTKIHLFNLSTANMLVVYLPHDHTFSNFQELVAAQTNITARNQLILFENLPIEYWVQFMTLGQAYPTTTTSNPIFLYYNKNTHGPKLEVPEISKFPQITINADLEGDVGIAKACAGLVWLIKHRVVDCIHYQQLVTKAARMYL